MKKKKEDVVRFPSPLAWLVLGVVCLIVAGIISDWALFMLGIIFLLGYSYTDFLRLRYRLNGNRRK